MKMSNIKDYEVRHETAHQNFVMKKLI